ASRGASGPGGPLMAELLFQEVEILDMSTIRDTRTGKYAKQPKVGPHSHLPLPPPLPKMRRSSTSVRKGGSAPPLTSPNVRDRLIGSGRRLRWWEGPRGAPGC
ncbi:unnamed protein product, partial [Tetraodon nigroviridis]